jgi:hypothetical protein
LEEISKEAVISKWQYYQGIWYDTVFTNCTRWQWGFDPVAVMFPPAGSKLGEVRNMTETLG